MYKFTHHDKQTNCTIEMTLHNEDQGLNELLEHFQYFLSGCSFFFDVNDTIEKVNDIDPFEGFKP